MFDYIKEITISSTRLSRRVSLTTTNENSRGIISKPQATSASHECKLTKSTFIRRIFTPVCPTQPHSCKVGRPNKRGNRRIWGEALTPNKHNRYDRRWSKQCRINTTFLKYSHQKKLSANFRTALRDIYANRFHRTASTPRFDESPFSLPPRKRQRKQYRNEKNCRLGCGRCFCFVFGCRLKDDLSKKFPITVRCENRETSGRVNASGWLSSNKSIEL